MSKRKPSRPGRAARRAAGADAPIVTGPRLRQPIGLRGWMLAVAAAVLAFSVFLPTLDNTFVDWDDTGVLVDHDPWRGLGPEQIRWMFTTNHYGHYQPVTWLTYGLDFALWGMNPTGYHLTNNLFHAANTLLVFILTVTLLRRATQRSWPRWAIDVSGLVAALLFGLHPLRVESVAWATERRDLVSAFFLLLTVLAYLRAVGGGATRWRWIAISLGLYVLSMLGKVGGAPLPVVLLALDGYPLGRLGRRALVEKLPYFVIAIGFAVATLGAQAGVWLFPLERHDLLARSAQACYGLVFYIWKTLVPLRLLPLYELRMPLEPFELRFIASAIAVVAGGVGLFLTRRRWPALATVAIVYAAMLGPLLGFFQNGPQIVADRYSYLSCLGWLILIAAAAGTAMTRGTTAVRAAVAVGVVAAVTTLGALTVRQCEVWQSTETLWAYVVERDPDSSYANNSHGYVLLDEHEQPEMSVPFFRKALAVNDRNREAWLNLFNALKQLDHRSDELVICLQEGTAAFDPVIRGEAWYRLGRIAYDEKDYPRAVDHYTRAIENNETAPACTNLSLALSYSNRFPEAERVARRAIELDPTLFNARLAHIRSLNGQGRRDEALAVARIAVQMRPDSANANWWLRTLSDS